MCNFLPCCFPALYAPGSGEFAKGWSNDNNGYPNSGPEVERLTEIVPSARQLAYAELEYYTFIHYGMNTFTNSEWGTGKESPSQFNPQKVDTDQWVQAVKASGSKGIIFTAKHHDGFCLFPSDYTTHDIASSPYQDGQGEYRARSCRKAAANMKWNSAFTSPPGICMSQPTEQTLIMIILSASSRSSAPATASYLPFGWMALRVMAHLISPMIFDRYYEVIRTYQPNAVIAVSGPDVRWIGNEAGNAV